MAAIVQVPFLPAVSAVRAVLAMRSDLADFPAVGDEDDANDEEEDAAALGGSVELPSAAAEGGESRAFWARYPL